MSEEPTKATTVDLEGELEAVAFDEGCIVIPIADLSPGSTVTITIVIGPQPAPEPPEAPAGKRYLGGAR